MPKSCHLKLPMLYFYQIFLKDFDMKEIFTGKITRFVLISFLFVTITCFAYVIPTNDVKWILIIWNCFLAVVPLYCAMFVNYFLKLNKKLFASIFSVIWLLFFPNSLYMLTDFKYISNFKIETWDNYQAIGSNVINWFFLADLVVSIFCGVLFGMISLYIMQNLVRERFSRLKTALFVVFVMLLSSFGIYIGRFPRLNSWDVFRPWFLIEKIFSLITVFTVFFVLYFTILSLMVYIIFYFAVKIMKK